MAMSPPRLTRTPPARPVADMTARAARSEPTPLAVAPRSSRMPAGSQSTGPSSRTRSHPGAGAGGAGGSPRRGSIVGEVTVVTERDERIADRRINASAGPPGCGQRYPDRFGQAFAEQEQAASGTVQPAEF